MKRWYALYLSLYSYSMKRDSLLKYFMIWFGVRTIARIADIPATRSRWCKALMFSVWSVWITYWTNRLVAGDLRCHDDLISLFHQHCSLYVSSHGLFVPIHILDMLSPEQSWNVVESCSKQKFPHFDRGNVDTEIKARGVVGWPTLICAIWLTINTY